MTEHDTAHQATTTEETKARLAAASQTQRFRAIMREARRRLSEDAQAQAQILDIFQMLIAHPLLRVAVHDEICHWGVRLVSAKQTSAQEKSDPHEGDAHVDPCETDKSHPA